VVDKADTSSYTPSASTANFFNPRLALGYLAIVLSDLPVAGVTRRRQRGRTFRGAPEVAEGSSLAVAPNWCSVESDSRAERRPLPKSLYACLPRSALSFSRGPPSIRPFACVYTLIYANQGLNCRNGPEPLLNAIQFLCGPCRCRISPHTDSTQPLIRIIHAVQGYFLFSWPKPVGY